MTVNVHNLSREKRLFLFLGIVSLILFSIDPALAGDDKKKELDIFKMVTELLGGLAIFLYGMDVMVDALKGAAGERLKDILATMTNNRFAGVLTGAGVTAVVQSSSVTTVVVVGFVTAGLMTLTQAIGVIFGANIGTTITAQIVAFKVTKYALLMIFFGWLATFTKPGNIRTTGLIVMGLGMVFFGMHLMGEAMKPLRSYQPFLDMMQSMENPIMGILVALAFTGIIQSSSATTSLVIVMASQGLVTLPAGIALAFGANIGTCVTALLACIGKNRPAVQAAMAHLLFNVIGVLLWVFFIDQLADLVTLMSPIYPDKEGLARLAAETPRQIANAHTVFNVANTVIFLPFVAQFAALVAKLVPLREGGEVEAATAAVNPQYLDEGMLGTPPLALSMVRREARRMSETVEAMLQGVPEAVFKGNVDKMAQLKEMDDTVDALYGHITRYLSKISRQELSIKSSNEALVAMTATTEMENIGDIVETHLFHLANVCSSNNIRIDEETMRVLTGYHEMVVKAFHSAVVAYEHDREDTAKMVLKMEEDIIGSMEAFTSERHRSMIANSITDANAYAVFTLESDILENFKRIYQHTKRIARLVTKEEGSTALMAV